MTKKEIEKIREIEYKIEELHGDCYMKLYKISGGKFKLILKNTWSDWCDYFNSLEDVEKWVDKKTAEMEGRNERVKKAMEEAIKRRVEG